MGEMGRSIVVRTSGNPDHQNHVREKTVGHRSVLLLLHRLKPGRALRSFDSSTNVTQRQTIYQLVRQVFGTCSHHQREWPCLGFIFCSPVHCDESH